MFARVNQFCITPGINGILSSSAGGDDIVQKDMGILSGANGICESSKVDDDRQLVPSGSLSFSSIERINGVSNNFLDPGENFLDQNGNGVSKW